MHRTRLQPQLCATSLRVPRGCEEERTANVLPVLDEVRVDLVANPARKLVVEDKLAAGSCVRECEYYGSHDKGRDHVKNLSRTTCPKEHRYDLGYYLSVLPGVS